MPPAQAVASGRYTHVPILMGDNHDEGRTFAQGLAGLTGQQYTDLVTQEFGARAPEVLQHYPFSSYSSPYTAAYAIGAVWTDSVHHRFRPPGPGRNGRDHGQDPR